MIARPADRNQRLRARSAGALLTVLLLAACDNSAERGPGGVSEGEARALDEAAEMLDKQQLPEGAIPSVEAPMGNEAPAEPPTEVAEANDEAGGATSAPDANGTQEAE